MSKQVIGEKEAAEGPNKRAKVALPTKDEQKQLQQVELLMKSNLLQLQVDQILEEVSGEAIMGKKRVIEWAAGLVQLLKSVDSFKGLSGTALNKKTIKKLGLKSINQLALVNGSDESMKVEFLPPAAADLVGSTENHTSLSAMFNIDIAVTMPASMFESRDILNHRYFDKRKLYLLGLYQALQKHSGEDHALYSAASFAAFKSDLRKPILVLQAPFTVSRAGSAGVTARIIPVIAEEGVFRAVQLRAGKNNVRPSHWGSTSEDATGAEEGKDAASLPPTPLYNLAILEDMAVLTQHRILQKTVAPSSALAKALTLFKIWLTQRGFRFAADGFDGHCAGLLLSYLLLTRRVAGGAATSPLSAFQTMLTFIAEGHLLQCGLDFRSADLGSRKNIANVHASAGMGGLASNGGVLMPDDSAVAISSDLKHSSVLDERSWDFKRPLSLIHPLGMQTGGAESCRYNSLWRVSASAANMLQSEAVRSLKELQHQENACCFDHLFMQRRSFYERHDQFYHLRVEGQTLPFLANSSIHVGKEQAEVSPAFRAISEMPAAARKELRSILLHVPAPEHFAAAAVQVVSKGLGDRAVSVHSLVRCVSTTSADSDTTEDELEVSAHTPVWTVPTASDAAADSNACNWIVSIGVVLDREKMDRRVERGPTAAQANIPDIAADPALFHSNGNGNSAVVDDELHRFRNFWGPKVQLRRFKDGAIMESVVWETAPMGGGVVEQVAKFLLGRHLPAVCGGDGSLVRAVNSQLESAVLASSLGTGSSSDDMQSRRAVEALDKLRTVLTSQIKRLPLAYEALMAAAPELRYTAIQAPSQHPFVLAASGAADEGSDKALKRILKQYAGRNVSLLTTPMRVLVQAESSGKWPLEAEAISKAKLAMLLKTKTELKSQFQIQSVIHEDCLDVCYEGYLFRLQIVATPEIEAIQMAAAVRGSVSGTQEIQRAVVRNVVVPPLHHLSVRALRAQFPSYSGAVRLLALWAAQHYFSGHLCLELIELIVAYEYLHPFTSQPPSSPMAGFYRALLRLADHNWDADPLVVDLSGESKEITGNSALQLQIVTQFRSVRDPAAIAALEEAAVSGDLDAAARRHLNAPMYIVSSADKAHGYWPSLAERSPERVVLAMIVRTAKLSAQRLLGWIQRSYSEASVEEAAIASILGDRAVLDKCDVVLKVNKALLNKNPKEGPTFATLSVFANTSAAEASISNLVVCEAECAAHPIQEDLVRKLRRAFGNSALFFWNSSSGREIGLIWRPRILQPSSFAVLACKGRQVCEAADSTMTEANMPQLLCEMLDVADGLVVQAEEVSK